MLGAYGEWAAQSLPDIPRLSFRQPIFTNLDAWRAVARARFLELLNSPGGAATPIAAVTPIAAATVTAVVGESRRHDMSGGMRQRQGEPSVRGGDSGSFYASGGGGIGDGGRGFLRFGG